MEYSLSNPTHAEVIGQSLIDYFESEEFPMELLQDPTLNSLYLRNELKKTLEQQALFSEERCTRMRNAFKEYYKRAGKPDPCLY